MQLLGGLANLCIPGITEIVLTQLGGHWSLVMVVFAAACVPQWAMIRWLEQR